MGDVLVLFLIAWAITAVLCQLLNWHEKQEEDDIKDVRGFLFLGPFYFVYWGYRRLRFGPYQKRIARKERRAKMQESWVKAMQTPLKSPVESDPLTAYYQGLLDGEYISSRGQSVEAHYQRIRSKT